VKGLVLTCANSGLTNLNQGRDEAYISREERQQIDSIRQNPDITEQQKIYNSFLNGDWKRQDLYKPTQEEMARFALYEWDNDPDFRNSVGQEAVTSDLEEAFNNCPIPTMIQEGTQDMTWDTDKPGKFKNNHPNARLVEFNDSAHHPFQDEPERFFDELESFIAGLPQKTPNLALWQKHIAEWEEARQNSPDNLIGELSMAEEKDAYEKIAALYSPDWLEVLKYSSSFREAGFALYIVENYEEALKCFKKMETTSTMGNEEVASALIWQGHMLDLLERRDESILVYQKVVKMDINQEITHDQFDFSYRLSPYAAERIKEPFTRAELV
jgi:tetratricopeptide (TPR) repeat protein